MSFSYKNDFDENGIVYFLGSIRGKWQNPALRGRHKAPPLIKLSASSLKSGPKSIALLCGRESGRLLTKNEEGSWFQLYFGKDKRIVPSAYTLRHYSSYHQECVRNWRFVASNNGSEWETLSEHKNDTSITGKAGTATFSCQSQRHAAAWLVLLSYCQHRAQLIR